MGYSAVRCVWPLSRLVVAYRAEHFSACCCLKKSRCFWRQVSVPVLLPSKEGPSLTLAVLPLCQVVLNVRACVRQAMVEVRPCSFCTEKSRAFCCKPKLVACYGSCRWVSLSLKHKPLDLHLAMWWPREARGLWCGSHNKLAASLVSSLQNGQMLGGRIVSLNLKLPCGLGWDVLFLCFSSGTRWGPESCVFTHMGVLHGHADLFLPTTSIAQWF